MRSSNEKVNEFLADIQLIFSDKSESVEEIRKLFLNENPEIDEEIKYGGIVFNVSEQLVGGLFVYKKHISIEFSNGASFKDPKGKLEGKGKMRRHLKIFEKNDINDKSTVFFIKQAVMMKK